MYPNTFVTWLLVGLVAFGTVGALCGRRRSITLSGAAVASAAFTVAMGAAAAEGEYLAVVAFTGAAVACALLFGSAARHRPAAPPPAYPVVTRIRDLSGHTVSIETLDATAVHRRGLGEAPGTLAIVERRGGKYVQIHATAPDEHRARALAASVADALPADLVDARPLAVVR
ncbi:hypothetical protein [Actinomadura rubrisoli]|uniref:Uncharacterized protein n=1 Tax=Actinomadura rubrisoli TaxID=2530368 RepID=A0A4V2YS25_9ACTN|nr:hypothetical protein [Actinomadura rubrisoli]TDD68577.1 hypothetical protein E1298_38245 [Actinomadura rubrisoli]